jgi:hypothetical protein
MNTYVVAVTGIWRSIAEFHCSRFQVKAMTPGEAVDKGAAAYANICKHEFYSATVSACDDEVTVLPDGE